MLLNGGYVYNRFIEMKVLMKLFESELQKYLNIENYIDCKNPPDKLLRELRNSPSQMKKLAKAFQSHTSNPIKLIRTYSLALLLLIYGKDMYEFVENHLIFKPTKDDWLNTKFLQPLHHFIIKCCTSKQTYTQCKTITFKRNENLQMLFYSINMMKQLFRIVEKMPLMGRYYKPTFNSTVSTAVEVLALQAQKLYAVFKHCLGEILLYHQIFLKTKENQLILRGILVDELTYINQEMKKLFLDKYFYPLGKGIGVKLFRPEEQVPQCEKKIQSIVSNHEETERQKKHEQLQNTLFPGSGLVNWNFYQQTLLSGPNLNATAGLHTSSKFIDLDDLAISQQDEDEEARDKHTAQDKTDLSQSQKQTNTGTIQIKDGEM